MGAVLDRGGFWFFCLAAGLFDSLDRIAAIARATTSIPVGSAIISPDVFTPDAVLRLYADLQTTAPNRFVVGLGSSQKPRSLAALNDYFDMLDRGDPPVPAERRILAALGPRKLELARDRCAGAITLLVTPDFTRAARRTLGADSTLVVEQMLVLDTDASHARETARGSLRFLSGVRGYRSNFERMGFESTDISDLSDRLVDDLVVWGDADAIGARVNEHRDAGADQVVLDVLAQGDQPGPIEVARMLAGKLVG